MKKIIYLLRNRQNGKCYVGQTTQTLKRRVMAHKHYAFKRMSNLAIHAAIRKYGIESFEPSLLGEAGTFEELDAMESHYISVFNSMAPHGYNLHTGGAYHECSDETKEKLRKAARKRPPPFLGMRHSEEAKARISAAKMGNRCAQGHVITPEQRQKMLAGIHPFKHTEEAKKKISKARKGMKFTDDHRAAISKARKGKKLTDAHRAAMSVAQKRRHSRSRKDDE
jgi:group I intron endonuclease